MSKGVMAALGVVAVVLLMGFTFIGAVIGFNNTAIPMENGIKAQLEQNKNNYDNYFKKLKEAVQLPDLHTEDLVKVYGAEMTGRYGKDGSKGVFQWMQEHAMPLDATLRKKVQDIIEAGRNSFEADQKMLIDKKREYDNYRQVFPNNVLAGFLGFPKINLDDYAIVTSDETEKAFGAKKSEPFQLR